MKITIIEDNKLLAKNIAKKLKKNWFNYIIFNKYNDFRKEAFYNSDLFIIDIELGDWNWFDIIKYIRNEKKSTSPILICSWFSDEEHKIMWFNLWIDDYITKPFFPEELIFRIKAIIKRFYKIEHNKSIKLNLLKFYIDEKKLLKGDFEIKLSPIEKRILEIFFLNIGKVVSKELLINSAWGEHDSLLISDNTIIVTMSRLRKKLWNDLKLVTINNIWYLLEKEDKK